MKKRVAVILPLLILSTVSVAQDPSKTETEPIPIIAEETSAAEPDSVVAESYLSYRIAVNFEPNSLELTPLSSAALDSMSVIFSRNKHYRYEVHGYTCPYVEGPNRPVRLSAQRVERIVYHLIKLGVAGENILTVVNAPKSANAGAKECTEDRQVDIISSGTRWRDQAPEPRQTTAPDHDLIEELRASVMDSLKRKLAEAEEPKPQTSALEPPPIQPITSEPGKQIVAVYMAGQEPQNAKGVHYIVGGELARVMSESDKYTAVDRTEAILAELDREHVYQRSGAVDDEQIKAIGHQLGVQYLCISNINPVGKRYYLDTRLVDIVSAEIMRSVTATSTLKDANEMTRVGRNIALELLEADKTREQRARRKFIFRSTAVSLDVLGLLAFTYGYIENRNVVKNVEHIDEANIKNGPEAQRAATRRDVAYIVSGALIASGVTVHIVF
ncbi:MAG: hypothetical protein LBC59_04320 [Chitinispirillales bacterium]|jgi:outer membrane protein OmpA-like peptidoglycan-associated protein/TolB-like protein|nr:hypothetical protein [Chitinispirillales bacterium]